MATMNRFVSRTCGKLVLCFFLLLSYIYKVSYSSSVQMRSDNINDIIHQNELVFVNFYADWCRFSNILAPIFDEAAQKVKDEFPQVGKVVLAKVDCDAETAISNLYHISKYPTLKLFRDGQIMKKEYRGQRSAESLVTFIRDQLKDNVKVVDSMESLQDVEKDRSAVIGYFALADSANYAIFQRMARRLRDDCNFFALFGEESKGVREDGDDKIVFRPKVIKCTVSTILLTVVVVEVVVLLTRLSLKKTLNIHSVPLKVGDESFYSGDISAYETLQSWGSEKCVPLVREITFENAEELTEEGLPFLILFHHPDDKETVSQFTETVATQLMDERSNVNFLVADGLKFSHPLHHLGKTEKDLPVLAIDSFRHMYIFPEIKDLTKPYKLKQFLLDLHSGKLHREFHHGPDPEPETPKPEPELSPSEGGDIPREDPEPSPSDEAPIRAAAASSDPPESMFVNLAPSRNRYTILKDEL